MTGRYVKHKIKEQKSNEICFLNIALCKTNKIKEEDKMKDSCVKKGLVIGVICLLMLVSVPNISSYNKTSEPVNMGGLADNVPITCHGAYWINAILREWVFGITLINNNDVPINFKMLVDVTKRDGTILFDCSPVILPYPFKNGTLGHVQLVIFPQFREKRHLFGFFDVYVDFTVFEDGSSRKKVFHGLIFGISAVIFDIEGEIIE